MYLNYFLGFTTLDKVNDNSPQFTSANSATIPEKSTAVLSLNATDGGDTVTYMLDNTNDNDGSLFTIDAATHALSFKTAPDYEYPACSDNSCTVSVVASDSVNTATQTITIVADSDGDGIPDTEDVDDDNDGLIEIHNLDMLYNMRYNLDATSYKTSASDTGTTGPRLRQQPTPITMALFSVATSLPVTSTLIVQTATPAEV